LLLFFKFLDFFQESGNFFDFTLFSQGFGLVVEKLDFLVQLVNLFMHCFLLQLIHFIGGFWLLC